MNVRAKPVARVWMLAHGAEMARAADMMRRVARRLRGAATLVATRDGRTIEREGRRRGRKRGRNAHHGQNVAFPI